MTRKWVEKCSLSYFRLNLSGSFSSHVCCSLQSNYINALSSVLCKSLHGLYQHSESETLRTAEGHVRFSGTSCETLRTAEGHVRFSGTSSETLRSAEGHVRFSGTSCETLRSAEWHVRFSGTSYETLRTAEGHVRFSGTSCRGTAIENKNMASSCQRQRHGSGRLSSEAGLHVKAVHVEFMVDQVTLSTSVFPCHYHSINAPYSYIYIYIYIYISPTLHKLSNAQRRQLTRFFSCHYIWGNNQFPLHNSSCYVSFSNCTERRLCFILLKFKLIKITPSRLWGVGEEFNSPQLFESASQQPLLPHKKIYATQRPKLLLMLSVNTQAIGHCPSPGRLLQATDLSTVRRFQS